jgi:hypothetical protein
MRRWAAVGGILGPVAFITAWAVLGGRRSGYDPVTQHISQLAADGVAERPAMTAGFVAFGVGVPIYALALRRGLTGPAWITAVATGAATLGVAAFPLDASFGDTPHAVSAGIGYATLAATPLLAARPLRQAGLTKSAAASVVAGALSGGCLLATVFFPWSGLLQRVGLTIGDVWLISSASALMRGRLDQGRRGEADC